MFLFYVQHLLGTGHLQRVRLIAGELAARGHRVTVASGGMAVPGMDFGGADVVQLEPLRSDGIDFGTLLEASGRVAGADVFRRRRERLVGLVDSVRPRVLVVETFPFGRRAFGDEVVTLVEAVRQADPAARVVCSIRDVLQVRKPARERETMVVLDRYFDRVLVHGDPAVIPLGESFSLAAELAGKLHYTGYVAPAPVPRELRAGAEGEVVVAAGGGAVGANLYRCALEAAGLGPGRRWRILVGGGVDDARLAELRAVAPNNAILERNRADFRELLSASAALVSQAGYNTCTDIMVTGVPALLIPFEAGGETEQLHRAQKLRALGMIELLREAELGAGVLADRVGTLLRQPEPILPALELGGVAASADRLEGWALN